MTHQDIISIYHETESAKETARISGLSPQKVRRILITAGEWSSPRTDEITRLWESGKTVAEISALLGIAPKTVAGHLPYRKGEYKGNNPSGNALNIRRYRERKRNKVRD